jgi:hypothetical protein
MHGGWDGVMIFGWSSVMDEAASEQMGGDKH